MGFNMSEMLESKYLSKDDVDTVGVDGTIAGITREEVGADRDVKYIIHFKQSYLKPMVVNKTNNRMLVNLFGDDSDGWINKTVCVYNDPSVGYAGQITGGVRLRPVQVAPKMTKAQLLAAAANFPEEDDLP